MAGTIDSFSYGKKCSFLCKTFSLFLPCNMAAVQNLYLQEFTGLPWTHKAVLHFGVLQLLPFDGKERIAVWNFDWKNLVTEKNRHFQQSLFPSSL